MKNVHADRVTAPQSTARPRMTRSCVPAALLVLAFSGLAQQPVEIRVDAGATQGPFRPMYAWFGYDESNYTTTDKGRALLQELHDATPAPVYVRAHFLLTSGEANLS